MEKTRQDAEREIDEESIQKWLSHALPVVSDGLNH